MKLLKKITLFGLIIFSYTLHAQIAYYPFDGNANDVVSGFDGTVNGATLASDRNGNPNSAYLFDGINDHIEVVNSDAFNFGTDEFAVSLWIKPLNSASAFQMIFIKGGLGGSADPHYWLRLNDPLLGGAPMRALWGNGTQPLAVIDYDDSSFLSDGEWHHILFQRTNQRNELYVDCVLIGTNNVSKDISGIGNLLLGAQHPNPPTSSVIYNFYSGLMDDVAIYDKAFTNIEAIDSLCLDIVTDVTSPTETQDESIELYPIPTTNKLRVDYYANSKASLYLEILSNDGKVLLTRRIEGQKGMNNIELDLVSLATGHYYVRIYGADSGLPQMQSFVKINP